MDRKIKFSLYNTFNSILNAICSFLIYPLNVPLYRMIFREYGAGSYIDKKCFFRYFNKIVIGSNVEINRECIFLPGYKSSSRIFVGDNVLIAPRVSFYAAGQNPGDIREDVGGDIIIGNNVYIGANAVIRYGVTIADNVVVGAGSIVVKDLLKPGVYAGNPAKLVRNIV